MAARKYQQLGEGEEEADDCRRASFQEERRRELISGERGDVPREPRLQSKQQRQDSGTRRVFANVADDDSRSSMTRRTSCQEGDRSASSRPLADAMPAKQTSLMTGADGVTKSQSAKKTGGSAPLELATRKPPTGLKIFQHKSVAVRPSVVSAALRKKRCNLNSAPVEEHAGVIDSNFGSDVSHAVLAFEFIDRINDDMLRHYLPVIDSTLAVDLGLQHDASRLATRELGAPDDYEDDGLGVFKCRGSSALDFQFRTSSQASTAPGSRADWRSPTPLDGNETPRLGLETPTPTPLEESRTSLRAPTRKLSRKPTPVGRNDESPGRQYTDQLSPTSRGPEDRRASDDSSRPASSRQASKSSSIQGDPAATAERCACGNVFAGDAIICRKCGTPRPVPERCACGNVFAGDAIICRKCGTPRPSLTQAQQSTTSASHSSTLESSGLTVSDQANDGFDPARDDSCAESSAANCKLVSYTEVIYYESPATRDPACYEALMTATYAPGASRVRGKGRYKVDASLTFGSSLELLSSRRSPRSTARFRSPLVSPRANSRNVQDADAMSRLSVDSFEVGEDPINSKPQSTCSTIQSLSGQRQVSPKNRPRTLSWSSRGSRGGPLENDSCSSPKKLKVDQRISTFASDVPPPSSSARGHAPTIYDLIAEQKSARVRPNEDCPFSGNRLDSNAVDLRCGHKFALDRLETAIYAGEVCFLNGLGQKDSLICPLCGDHDVATRPGTAKIMVTYSQNHQACLGDLRKDMQLPVTLPVTSRDIVDVEGDTGLPPVLNKKRVIKSPQRKGAAPL